MKFGFVVPDADAGAAADLGADAEMAGWDGFFVWEPIWGIDAWVTLTAVAMRTRTIRLGTLLTPLSRMRPWKLASEAATLDRLSQGRVTLSVGLGALDTGFAAFGEVTDRRARAALLDESLDIITGLWQQGHPFRYDGRHYQIETIDFSVPPPPVQRPRIPIWCVGAWPSRKSMARVLRCDGLLPQVMQRDEAGQTRARQATRDELGDMVTYLHAHRSGDSHLDVIVEGETDPADHVQSAETIAAWSGAGATWWIESLWSAVGQPDAVAAARRRIRQGPPRF